ncbi:hypothetical protein RHO14_03535 [Orbus wheelerorum]|uniref:hypothetical protein n=1 Tax=Orbus wheelerorum TaxID=3074111 RepID=UPI00370D100D
MARRREFFDIAHGISSSFNSRNNDLQGYWAIGILYKYLSTNNITSIVFDILNNTSTLNTEKFPQIISRYSALLYYLLGVKNINYNWVKSATIKIDFNQYNKTYHDQIFYPIGDPYTITMTLIDDRGKIFEANSYGKCRYHDPNKEFKRG